jgi:hypothetical protein
MRTRTSTPAQPPPRCAAPRSGLAAGVAVLLFLLTIVLAAASAEAAPLARAWFEPSPVVATPGGSADIGVWMNTTDPTGVGAVGLIVDFDAAWLRVRDVEAGWADTDPQFVGNGSVRLSFSGDVGSGLCGPAADTSCPGADGQPFLLARLGADVLQAARGATCLRVTIDAVGNGGASIRRIATTAQHGAVTVPGAAPPDCGPPATYAGEPEAGGDARPDEGAGDPDAIPVEGPGAPPGTGARTPAPPALAAALGMAAAALGTSRRRA